MAKGNEALNRGEPQQIDRISQGAIFWALVSPAALALSEMAKRMAAVV